MTIRATTKLHYLVPDWSTPEKRWQNSASSHRQKDQYK